MAIAAGQARLFRLLKERGIWPAIKSVCELGSQEPRADELTGLFQQFHKPTLVGESTARDLYRHLGISQYTSIDFNGEHGALPYDLNRNLRKDYNFGDRFDLVTNFGTSEHCFNQFEVFRNIHELCAPGGCMLHTNPSQGWGRHCLVRYDPNFFEDLAAANDYELLFLEPFLRLKPYLHKNKSQTIAPVRAMCDFAESKIDHPQTSANSVFATDAGAVADALVHIGKGDALFSITLACAMRKRGDGEFVTPIQGVYRK